MTDISYLSKTAFDGCANFCFLSYAFERLSEYTQYLTKLSQSLNGVIALKSMYLVTSW